MFKTTGRCLASQSPMVGSLRETCTPPWPSLERTRSMSTTFPSWPTPPKPPTPKAAAPKAKAKNGSKPKEDKPKEKIQRKNTTNHSLSLWTNHRDYVEAQMEVSGRGFSPTVQILLERAQAAGITAENEWEQG